MALKPGKCLERAFQIIDFVFKQSRTPYWVHFGALIGIAKKNGIIPDGDIDLCTYYESNTNFERIVKMFEAKGFVMTKAIENDIDKGKVLYCGFNWGKPQDREVLKTENFMPHICLSFWYLHKGIRYYCHDQHKELSGGQIATPKSGIFFKGFEDKCIARDEENSKLMRCEWPGIPANIKVSVPILPCLEQMYPGWAYNQQRYMVNNNEVQGDKLRDCCREGAYSRYQVHVNSMADWNNEKHISKELEKSERNWLAKLKKLKKKNN